jgi:hypothetical protein
VSLSGEKGKWLVATLAVAVLGAALFTACGSSSGGADQLREKTKSGLLDFGEEGSTAELEEAEKAVRSVFLARSKEDWPATCAQVSRALREKIEHLAVSSTQLADKSCAAFLEAFLSLSEQERRQGEVIDAGTLREQGARAFLIYLGEGEIAYAISLKREGDAWKADSLSPKRLS